MPEEQATRVERETWLPHGRRTWLGQQLTTQIACDGYGNYDARARAAGCCFVEYERWDRVYRCSTHGADFASDGRWKRHCMHFLGQRCESGVPLTGLRSVTMLDVPLRDAVTAFGTGPRLTPK